MLAVVVVIVVAALVVYIVHKVNPKRVRLRAGVGKLTILDFEADGGSPPSEQGAEGYPQRGSQGELIPGKTPQ